MKLINYILAVVFIGSVLAGCNNLDETLYSSIGSNNYYNTRDDVLRAAYRPFEHAFWSISSRHVLNELSADQIITPVRDGWWDDGGVWRLYHYHQWTDARGADDSIIYEWSGCFQGIGQCNFVIEELAQLNPAKFGFTQADFDNLTAQCRVLRAWFYIRLLDAFRNVPYVVSFNDQSKNTETQVEPSKIFKLIEDELKECIDLVYEKGPSVSAGQWTRGAVVSLLVRLYLNAKVYIGEDRYSDCERYAQDLVDGKYGAYEIADRWDAAFDWDNDQCDEMIFGFPAAAGYTSWHYENNTFWNTVPANSEVYFGDRKCKKGAHNCHFAASPSYDLNGKLYDYELGMPVEKFRKYPGDERMKMYRNLGNGRREGMFLYGYIEYKGDDGKMHQMIAPEKPYKLYIRDAVGVFHDLAPDSWPRNKESTLSSGDHNSGYHFVKYPFYADDDPHQLESDYAEIRLPEVIYSLAECKLRRGAVDGAAELLNSVRRRNYPSEQLKEVLYAPEGKVQLNMNEMLDEWGREFFAEGRRRIDLIRFGKFSTGRWWDKIPDADNHCQIFPLIRQTLDTNSKLVQNPGY